MLAVSFDEKKNVYRVNQLLKIFNAAESIKKEDPTVSLPNLPKNLLRTSKRARYINKVNYPFMILHFQTKSTEIKN